MGAGFERRVKVPGLGLGTSVETSLQPFAVSVMHAKTCLGGIKCRKGQI